MACVNSRILNLRYKVSWLDQDTCDYRIRDILSEIVDCLDEMSASIEKTESEISSFNDDITELECSIEVMKYKED